MSNGTDGKLAKRYWDLLDFYPRWYRDSRGDELVGTLLDCARPGQTRPTWREARALVLEGLRVRAGTGGHRPARETLARGVQFGLLMLLALMPLEGLSDLATQRDYDDVRAVTAGWAVLVGLAVLAGVIPFVLVARGRVRLAVPFVAVAGAVVMAGYPMLHRTGWSYWFELPPDMTGILPISVDPAPTAVAVVVAALLAWLRPPAVGTATVVVAVVAPALFYVPGWFEDAGLLPSDFNLFVPVGLWLGLLFYFGVIWYAVVDARPAVALLVLLAVLPVEIVSVWLRIGEIPFSPEPVLLVPVGIAAWRGTRRQAAVALKA